MNQFNLQRVRFQGRDYERATITVDEVTKKADLAYVEKRLFSSKTLPLTTFGYDSDTKVSRYGSTVTVGNLELVAEKLDDASLLESILAAPHRLVREEALRSLEAAEESAQKFLETRRETIEFLKMLKADPAETMFQLYVATRSPPEDALKGRVKSGVEAMTSALDRLDAAIAELAQKAGPQVAERVYAVTYLGGKVQDNLLGRGEPGIKAEGFVSELGVKEGDLSPPFEDVPVNLITAAHQSTSAAIS